MQKANAPHGSRRSVGGRRQPTSTSDHGRPFYSALPHVGRRPPRQLAMRPGQRKTTAQPACM
eukprot:1667366-Alexandrium_andersonii.AAC.1